MMHGPINIRLTIFLLYIRQAVRLCSQTVSLVCLETFKIRINMVCRLGVEIVNVKRGGV